MIYKCKNCGSNTVFNPDSNKMVCPNCTSEESQEIVDASEPRKCVMCGADVEYKNYESATKCAYCGAYQILRERVEGVYEPNLILPFKISKTKAIELLRKDFKARLFTPGDFLSTASLEKMEGSYVPFWMFDYFCKYVYEGIGTKVRTWTTGDMQYTEKSKYQIIRNMETDFEKIPADASLNMPDDTMDLMEPYDYKELTGFDPKYLSGFFGEIYNDSADKFEPRSKKKARTAAEEAMKQSISGYASVEDKVRNLELSDRGQYYALMPVWIYTYRFQNKEYPFYVNGQTGKIVGKTPTSFQRVWGVAASMTGVLLLTAGLILKLLEVLM